MLSVNSSKPPHKRKRKEDDINSPEKQILKRRRGRKTVVERQYLAAAAAHHQSHSFPLYSLQKNQSLDEFFLVDAGPETELCEDIYHKISSMVTETHKAVVMQSNIRKLLQEEKETHVFFQKLANIILRHSKVRVGNKLIEYVDPPKLPEDIFSIRTKQEANPHTFTNTRKKVSDTAIDAGETQKFSFLFQAIQMSEVHVFAQHGRYTIWPPPKK